MSYLPRLPVRVRGVFSARAAGRHRHRPGVDVQRTSMAHVMRLDVVAGRGRRCGKRGLLPPAESWMPRPEVSGAYFPRLPWEEPGTELRPYVGCPTPLLNGEQEARGVAW